MRSKYVTMKTLQHVLFSLALYLVVVAWAGDSAVKDCLSTDRVQVATFQDEMDVSFCRQGRDVDVKVLHSNGNCEFTIRNSESLNLNDKWTKAKLSLKDNITLSANGTFFEPVGTCAVAPNTIKRVTVENARHILSDCSQGPAIYQVSSGQENIVIPWYEQQAQLVLKPLVDTQITVKAGDQDFVVCFNGTHTVAQESSSSCSYGAGTSDIYITIPESNAFIKVNTTDGVTETPIINGKKGALVKFLKTPLNGTVIIQQCIPQCQISHSGQDIPEDCPCSYTVWIVLMVIFLLVALALGGYIIYRLMI